MVRQVNWLFLITRFWGKTMARNHHHDRVRLASISGLGSIHHNLLQPCRTAPQQTWQCCSLGHQWSRTWPHIACIRLTRMSRMSLRMSRRMGGMVQPELEKEVEVEEGAPQTQNPHNAQSYHRQPQPWRMNACWPGPLLGWHPNGCCCCLRMRTERCCSWKRRLVIEETTIMAFEEEV